MKMFVINMESATSRRAELKRKLSAIGIDVDIFPAITPADHPEEHFAPLDKGVFFTETQRRVMEASEYACFASHLMLWHKCVEIGEAIVVLEDDAEPAPDCARHFAALPAAVAKFGFVRLEPREESWNYLRGKPMPAPIEVARYGDLVIEHPEYMYLRTSAYALTPAAAQRLIDSSRHASCPVDTYFRRIWVHRQPMFIARPPLFKLTAEAEESQICGRDIDAATSIPWLQRKLDRQRKHWSWFLARWQSRLEAARVRKAYGIKEN